MTYEYLYGGPLDGLPVAAVGAVEMIAGEAVAKDYPAAKGSKYIRRVDGRLHFEFGRWDLN